MRNKKGMGSTGEGGNSQIPDAGGGEKRELGAGEGEGWKAECGIRKELKK
jgi:hypothetical protein